MALTSFATLYYMIPRLWHTQLYSVRLANVHFWVATLGLVIYVTPMWVSGVTQGLMWRAVNPDGSLVYTFIDTVAAIRLYDVIRAVGGALFLGGVFIMFYNVWKTVAQGSAATWSPQPYAVMDLSPYFLDPDYTEEDLIRYKRDFAGAMTFDSERGLLYVVEPVVNGDGDTVIHVFRVGP